jgi:hypothetical protein
MCNCGNKRNEFAAQSSAKLSNAPLGEPPQKMWKDIYFEYTGSTGLTVTGAITSKRYRFNFTGDIQLIDYRDADGMRFVPSLKKQ